MIIFHLSSCCKRMKLKEEWHLGSISLVAIAFIYFCSLDGSKNSCWVNGLLNHRIKIYSSSRTIGDNRRKYKIVLRVKKSNINEKDINKKRWVNDVFKNNVPFEQRVENKRGARRLNHKFQHLYRHYEDFPKTEQEVVDVEQYLKDEGFPNAKAIMTSFPKLQELSRHVIPNVLFLKNTLMAMNKTTVDVSNLLQHVPVSFLGGRLEGSMAPKHAFLVHLEYPPHGIQLLENESLLLKEFMKWNRNDKAFCSSNTLFPAQNSNTTATQRYEQLQMLTTAFGRGLMAAARKEHIYSLTDNDNENHHDEKDNEFLTNAQLIHLLVQHGANPHETDIRGATLLHWSAGAGYIDGYEALLQYYQPPSNEEKKSNDLDKNTAKESDFSWSSLNPRAERDGATPLHWAAAGVKSQNIGSGGHLEMCKYILEKGKYHPTLVNARTKDDNSVLMWAAWSGSFDICKLLIRHRAEVNFQNRNGCTAAHWAASGGNLELCQYLEKYTDIDFHQPNHAGNTPLSHAVAYQHKPIVEWLLELASKNNDIKSEKEQILQDAQDLAWDFVQWQQPPEVEENHDDSDIYLNGEGLLQSNEIYDLFSKSPIKSTEATSSDGIGEELDEWYLATNDKQ